MSGRRVADLQTAVAVEAVLPPEVSLSLDEALQQLKTGLQ